MRNSIANFVLQLSSIALLVVVSGCGDSSGRPAGGAPLPVVVCAAADKLPLAAKDYVIEVNIPSDSDATAADITPTTKIAYTVMLPERCPGQLFPLVMQSHGYGGTRIKTIEDNDTIEATQHFPQINEIVGTLPRRGYVVISYDERGHGDSKPANGGGYARVIDRDAEVADARAILDWVYDNSIDGGKGAEKLPVLAQKNSGVAKDLRVGTLGLSYGGGFQLQLTALDDRIDTIVPNGTWHSLMYSLLPGDATKNGFDGLLCLLALTGGVVNTPVVATTCDLLGPTNAMANNIRTRADLTAAGADPTNPLVNGNAAGMNSRPITEDEVVGIFSRNGLASFKKMQQSNQPSAFKLRPVPALFLQGNRDVLFNLTEAYWNYQYFLEASGGNGDVRILSTEGGHMNPLANQVEGSANCGSANGVDAIFGWFDFQLKGIPSAAYASIPRVCISVSDTPADNVVPPDAGVTLAEFPVGSLSGTGALPSVLVSGTVSVGSTNINISPAFVKVVDVPEDGYVIAGIPTIDSITVDAGVAYVGVGIVRAGSTILVDQTLTSLIKGTHTNNRNLDVSDNTKVLMPGIGEKLQAGDQVGLVFYCTHPQYESAISTTSGGGAVTGLVLGGQGVALPVSLPAVSVCLNTYSATITNAAVPILKPGTYPGSAMQ